MSIRKRRWTSGGVKKTAWVHDYKDQHGKRHIATFRTKKEAEDHRTEVSGEVKRGTHTAPSSSVTVGEAADRWIAWAEAEEVAGDLERSTVRYYRTLVEGHVKPLLGKKKLSKLTAPMVEDYRRELVRTRSRVMAGKAMTALKMILNNAQREGLVAQNVAEAVRRSKRRRRVAEDRRVKDSAIPTKDEVRAMLARAEGRWRPLLVVLVFTGMRASELRGLTWDDVDLDAEVIRVRRRADRWNQLGPPKSTAGVRDIPMAPIVANTLKSWREECPRGDLGLIFPNGAGNVENHANIYRRGFGALQIACGIVDGNGKARYGLHALRHFAASHWIDQGFPPKKVQTLLGHAGIAMTLDTYGHLFPDPEDDRARFAAAEMALVGQLREAAAEGRSEIKRDKSATRSI